MIGGIEFRLGCRGLLRLARFDKQFLRHFDRSAAGALRSFWLAVLILPVAWFLYWLDIDETVPNVGVYMLARSVGYAYSWILFPMVLLIAGRLLDRAPEAPGCIAVCNWFSLLALALQLPPALLFAINPESGLAPVLSLMTLFYVVLVECFLLMNCLRVSAWQAAALVAIDVALSFFIIGPVAHTLGGAPLA